MTLLTPSILLALLLSYSLASPPLLPQSFDFEPSQEIVPLHRLPNTIIPSHYTVILQPILDPGHGTQFTAPGKVSINAHCRLQTSNITLHSLTINITESSVKVTEFPDGPTVPIASFSQDLEKEQFIIHFDAPLRPGQVYQIYLEFVAPVSREVLVGLYLSNYTTDNGDLRYLAVTDLEATDARRVFPCFDEPHLKATFDIAIIRLPKYHSLSNMHLLSTETNLPDLPGWVMDLYHRTEKMSTYLFCVAVSDFASEAATEGHWSKPVKIWGPSEYITRGAGKYAPDLTAKLLTALENYFGVDYSFSKMDKIAVPHFLSGAMENWGLNTYRFNRLLIEDGIATVAERVSSATTLSHELVHQWFGNLVTMEWWDDLWLNEGFASYYSNTAVQDIGLEDMLPLDTLLSDAVQRAMQYDVTSATHPVHYPAVTPTEIRILFDTITYSKGAALVRMMEAVLTEPIMREGLTAYLKKYSHDNAHQDDLFNTLNETLSSHPEADKLLPTNTDLKTVMDDWTLQSGFPVLTVSYTPGSPAIIFLQEKFKPDPALPVGEKWTIPISILTSTDDATDTTAKVWFLKTDAVKTFALQNSANVKWIVVNPRQTGYYRVRYSSEAALKVLIEQLHADHTVFDPQTRSALIDDNLNLAFAGYSTLESPLNLTMYLKNERHLVPWTTFVNNMAKPYRFFSRSSTANPFKNYILNLIKPTLSNIKLDPQPGEPIGNATILRNKLFEYACNLGDNDCVEYSVGKFREWMEDPSNNSIIFPDLRPYVYCTAVGAGGQTEWDFALSQYLSGNREVTKLNLLRSLACSKSAYRLVHLLDLAISLSSNIEESHRLTAFQAVVGNSAGVDIVLSYIRENFATINRRFGPSLIASVITALANSLHKPYDITDLEKFLADNQAALEPVQGTIQTALATINDNVRWMARNVNQFDNFVREVA